MIFSRGCLGVRTASVMLCCFILCCIDFILCCVVVILCLCSDCYLLSALSVLAERPELVENLILTPDVNDTGVYNGEEQHLTARLRLVP